MWSSHVKCSDPNYFQQRSSLGQNMSTCQISLFIISNIAIHAIHGFSARKQDKQVCRRTDMLRMPFWIDWYKIKWVYFKSFKCCLHLCPRYRIQEKRFFCWSSNFVKCACDWRSITEFSMNEQRCESWNNMRIRKRAKAIGTFHLRRSIYLLAHRCTISQASKYNDRMLLLRGQ